MLGPLHWLDWLLLALLATSIFVGVLRTFVVELASLVGFIAAYVGAGWLAPVLAGYLPIGTPGGAINHAAAMTLALPLILAVWFGVMVVVKRSVKGGRLHPVERTVGALMGGVRGWHDATADRSQGLRSRPCAASSA